MTRKMVARIFWGSGLFDCGGGGGGGGIFGHATVEDIFCAAVEGDIRCLQ